MDYNTNRNKIILPEYGRHVQKMVDMLLQITDKNDRTSQTLAVIKVMSQVLPAYKDSEEYQEKLWNHLFFMTDYKLDVDCQYEITHHENGERIKPQKIPYNQINRSLTAYGKFTEDIIKETINYQGDDKYYAILNLANQMKKLYLMWNKESVLDIAIIKDLTRLSKGKLVLPDDTKLVVVTDIQPQQQTKKTNQRNDKHYLQKRTNNNQPYNQNSNQNSNQNRNQNQKNKNNNYRNNQQNQNNQTSQNYQPNETPIITQEESKTNNNTNERMKFA
jgi:hypothetical protein